MPPAAAPVRSVAAVALVVLTILALTVASVAPAGAAPGPELTIGGEPTTAERETIEDLWGLFLDTFAAHWVCLGPLDVRVVDRAEDVYGSTQEIAAFYQFPPDAKVFIEHGKVNLDNLMHEFAHHLDISCGLGSGAFGRDFLRAQGLSVDRPWLTGPSWSAVPAEMFAESVVAFFGELPSIALTDGALAVAAGLADLPDSYEIPAAMSSRFRPLGLAMAHSSAVVARAFVTRVGVVVAF